jgi:hypothetical protein
MRRIGVTAVLGLCLLAGFYVGAKYGHPPASDGGPSTISQQLLTDYQQLLNNYQHPSYDAASGFPRPDAPMPSRDAVDDSKSTRQAAVAADAQAILGQCRIEAGGNWIQWQSKTEPYRSALQKRIDALKKIDDYDTAVVETQSQALEGNGEFPLFELGAHTYLDYLYDAHSLDELRRVQPVVAIDHWLRQRGIELIFVPLPKMTEVYIEHFLDPCPSDGVIAPHVRQTLFELLSSDVETVDGWGLFRPVREADPDYLYNTADPHWGPRGMRLMAREIAERIGRYDFGRRARYRLPIFTTALAAYMIDNRPGGIGSVPWLALSKAQQERATSVQPTTTTDVRLWDGQKFAEDEKSPVMLIGNSYAEHFREQLALELNLRIRSRLGGGMTTEVFEDFVREPETLDGVRVLVWITSEHHMAHFKPLPPPITAALKAK